MFALGGISGIGLSGTESTDSFLLISLFLSTFTERANWATWSERSKVKKSVLNLQLKQFEIPKKMLYCLHFLKSKKEFIFLQVSWQIIVKVSGRDWIPTFDRAQFWASSGRRSRKSSSSTRKMSNQKKVQRAGAIITMVVTTTESETRGLGISGGRWSCSYATHFTLTLCLLERHNETLGRGGRGMQPTMD